MSLSLGQQSRQVGLCGNLFRERGRPRPCFALVTAFRSGMELGKHMCRASRRVLLPSLPGSHVPLQSMVPSEIFGAITAAVSYEGFM